LYQIKSVISIVEHPRMILLGENTFNQNVGMKGVVLLQQTKQKDHPILIILNTFVSNSGFLYADALYIRRTVDSIYNADLVQSTHYCAGLYMVSNSFTNNIGCPATTKGVVLAYCYSSTDPGSDAYYSKDTYLDHQTLLLKTPTSEDQQKFLNTVNVEGFSAVTYSYAYGGTIGTLSYNMEKTIVSLNSFSSNYGGKDGAILSLEGHQYLEMSSNTFQYNGNNIADFMALYSSIVKYVQSSSTVFGQFKSSPVTDSFLTSFSNKMKCILLIDIANSVTFSGLTFTNNWIIDQGATTPVSHSLLLNNIYKSFSCTG
jgi:hypothetical protein